MSRVNKGNNWPWYLYKQRGGPRKRPANQAKKPRERRISEKSSKSPAQSRRSSPVQISPQSSPAPSPQPSVEAPTVEVQEDFFNESNQSYDFAKEEEEARRMREEALARKREEERSRQKKKMGSERPRIVLTWVERKTVPPDILEANKDLRKAMTKATPPGTLYTICETYDTYQHGGLFPMMHVSDDSGTINKLLNGGAVLDKGALGEGLRIDQGVFEEVANVRLTQESSSNAQKLMAVACFKSIEKKLNPTLIKEWKAWTGARAFLQDLIMSGLKCSSIKFLTRLAPYTSNEIFYYTLVTEISVTEASDEATFVDALQRFRVERWFGYQTVYKRVE